MRTIVATAPHPSGKWQEIGEFLSDQQLADMLGVTTRTTSRWRRDGAGPKYIRAGPRRILYRRVDVLTWAEANTFATQAAETVARLRSAT